MNGWVNIREAGDLIRHGARYDVIEMLRCPYQQSIIMKGTKDLINAWVICVTKCPLSYTINVTYLYHSAPPHGMNIIYLYMPYD